MKKPLRLNTVLSYSLAFPLALLLTIIVLFSVSMREAKERAEFEVAAPEAGLLAEQAALDPKEVDRLVKTRREEEKKARDAEEQESQRQAMIDEVESAGDDIWSRFHDYVVLGDSRAVGFYYYKFLQTSRVLAEGGDCIMDIESHMDEIRALDPSYIYLCYGLNDTGMGYWANGDEYYVDCKRILTELKSAFPDATIVVSSILPAKEFAMEQNPVWRKIPDFSEAMRKACGECGACFADNEALVNKYMDVYWDVDGVHLMPDFYPYWAANLLLAQLEGENQ